MAGDVQRALILVAQIFTNKFDMGDNLRNNVVFPTTSLQAAWETNDVRKCHVEKHGNRTQQSIWAGVCTKLRPMDGTAYKNEWNKIVVAKGTTDDNVYTHRKMRHTQRQRSRTIDLSRRVYGRICRDQTLGGGVLRYASRIIASSRSMREAEAGVAELKNQNREFKGYPRQAQIDGH